MPKVKTGLVARVSRGLRRMMGVRVRNPDHHWFDHPEMQARIAEAEADRREGRSRTFNSPEEAIAYLNRLA